ncbi:MAG: hypothetical protein BHW39_03605 [Firmicutes bacterium CAG:552_39_19]|nr:MAG: hypothetical protein BHW39_03605 [Firmicutes bacterium CAG:552_39_19]
MDRQNLYNIYQNNLELLENELGQVKKMTQINLGKLYYATLERKELGEITIIYIFTVFMVGGKVKKNFI